MSEELRDVLLHLTGPDRGARLRLAGDHLVVGTAAEADVRVRSDREPSVARHHATLHREGEGWILAAEPGRELFVNGEPFTAGRVVSGDVLQLGSDGPLLRLRRQVGSGTDYKSLREALVDCVDCARYGEDSLSGQAAVLLRSMPRELLTATSPWARLVVGLSLLLAVGSVAFQVKQSRELDRRFAETRGQVEAVAESLRAEEARDQLTPARIDSLRRVLAEREDNRMETGGTLDRASRSVMLLLGAYGFEDPESGRPVRITDVTSPSVAGQQRAAVGPEAGGPVLVRRYTGTAFAVTSDGHFITNRHLVRPWAHDTIARQVAGMGYRPVLKKMIGFLPGRQDPVPIRLVAESDSADLALLRAPDLAGSTEPLTLAEEMPRLGEEVYLLGYPTGVRALMARSDPEFLELLRDRAEGLDLPEVTRRLAAEGQVAPLTTRGIVGQVSRSAVVYDAQTAHGGSGGPVLGRGGRVVAVNMGLMPEFGGSNLGVPVRRVRQLLAQVDAAP